MNLQFKDFTLDEHIIPDLKSVRRNRRLMNDEMNRWLNENTVTDIINIESLEYELSTTIGNRGGIKFYGFRLWYRVIK